MLMPAPDQVLELHRLTRSARVEDVVQDPVDREVAVDKFKVPYSFLVNPPSARMMTGQGSSLIESRKASPSWGSLFLFTTLCQKLDAPKHHSYPLCVIESKSTGTLRAGNDQEITPRGR